MSDQHITLTVDRNTLTRLSSMAHRTGLNMESLATEFIVQGLSDAEDRILVQEMLSER